MTDLGKSIRTRLFNYAKKEGLPFQLVIIRYFQERLLYRLSLSQYSANFCLKGGVLQYFYSLDQTRPTRDIDFLGTNIPNERNLMETTFQEICSVYYPLDAVTFDSQSILAEEISGQDKYPGIRLFVNANIDTIRQRIQIDVGFGDIVTPKAVQLNYPTILPESKTPVIQAYSLETVVAEKFEAMIDLATVNSRMKDFYDVYQILTTQHLNSKDLAEAIQATFRNRETMYTPEHALFSPSFPVDPIRLRQWKVFLTKNHLDQSIDFDEVISQIKRRLVPIWEDLKEKD